MENRIVNANTLYVGGAGVGNYSTIQEAIDAASPGDTVFVYSGIYFGRIWINETINLIGEDRETTVIDGGGRGRAIDVNANYTRISGFTVNNTEDALFAAGIRISLNMHDNIIEGNICSNHFMGIYVARSHNNTISNNTLTDCFNIGVYLDQSTNNTIRDNSFLSNLNGVELHSSSNNWIYENEFENHRWGIYIWDSSENFIMSNNFSDNYATGILLESSRGIDVSSNILSDNNHGIQLEFVSESYFFNNAITNNGFWGIHMDPASGNIFEANNISSNGREGIWIEGESADNTIIDNSIMLNGADGIEFFLRPNNNTINNNDIILNAEDGIHWWRSYDNHLTDNNISTNGGAGVFLTYSSRTTIAGNVILHNGAEGIWIESESDNNIIEDCDILYNEDNGIIVWESRDNTMTNNTVSANGRMGIFLDTSLNCVLMNNSISNNVDGIYVKESPNTEIINNDFVSDGVYVVGAELEEFSSHTISNDNIVNGDPLYYYANSDGLNINGTLVGELILANCTNFIINNLKIDSTDVGIELAFSSDCEITGNDIMDNNRGICLYHSSGNKIYHNRMINNTQQAFDDTNDNLWNDSFPFGGNYWSDYSGGDYYQGLNQEIPGSDGLGDTEYVINSSGIDHYPLMESWDSSKSLPSAPLDVRATSGDTFIQLIWGPPSSHSVQDISGYRIYKGTFSGEVTFLTEINSTNYNDDDVTEGLTYYYRISALGDDGEGVLSNEIDVTMESSEIVPTETNGSAFLVCVAALIVIAVIFVVVVIIVIILVKRKEGGKPPQYGPPQQL